MPFLAHIISSFIPHHLRREIKELYLSTVILNFGVAMILIFEPIYLYTLGYSLVSILIFFLMVYVLYFFLMPFGAIFARRFGYEHSIVLSTVVFIAYYAIFYAIRFSPILFFIAPILYALQKTFYWPAYHADFARFSNASEDAREISGIDTVVLIATVFAPLASGFIIEFFGFGVLFVIVSVIFLVSNIPMLSTREVFEPKPYVYSQAFKMLFLPENRKRLIGYLGYGEELIVLVIWPVFMVVMVKDFLNVGSIVAASTLVTILLTLYIGRTADRSNKKDVLRFGTVVYAIVWLARTITNGPWGVFVVDSLSRLSKETISVPLVALTYERAKQVSIMGTVIFFEMSLVIGKLVAILVLLVVLSVIPPTYAFTASFIVAAFMTLIYLRV